MDSGVGPVDEALVDEGVSTNTVPTVFVPVGKTVKVDVDVPSYPKVVVVKETATEVDDV